MKKLRAEEIRGKKAAGKIRRASRPPRQVGEIEKSEQALRAALHEVADLKSALGDLAKKNRELVEQISQKQEKDPALVNIRSAFLQGEKQFLDVIEQERRRFGADLHDNLGQQLTAIEFLCQALREDLHGQGALQTQMGQICRYLREAVAETRRLARGLMPVSLGADGLADALSEMVRRMDEGPVSCQFVCAEPVKVWDEGIANHLFHIAQEAVNNAMKHSHAKKITVSLSRSYGTVLLKIEDDGQGYPSAAEASVGQGLGLQIMQHRASVIGATLEVKSSPGKGVTVICTLRRHG